MGFCRTESVKAALMETTATTNHFLLTFLEVLYEALRMLNFFDYRVTDLFVVYIKQNIQFISNTILPKRTEQNTSNGVALLPKLILEGKMRKYHCRKSAEVERQSELSAHLGTAPELNKVKLEIFNEFHCFLDQGSQFIPLSSVSFTCLD